MAFAPVKLIFLFAWFLCGLYALKVGDEKLGKRHSSLREYYNLFALFLGPLAIAYCYLRENAWDFLLGLFRESRKSRKAEIPVVIRDAKGNPLADSEDEHGTQTFLKQLIYDAVKKQCSDIFIDPKNEGYSVRIRVDGAIKVYNMLTVDAALAVISTVKVAAGMDIAEKRRPQDGSFSALVEEDQPSFRVASVGVFGGEKITIRVMASDMGQHKLSTIGLSSEQYKIISSAIRLPSGMVLMCGPTGSGKTTTLYAMLGAIDYNMKNVISIEDPIEHVMPAISQMEVNVKADITFASLLRNALRQNPDVICVGEIRDEETAEIAVHASQTGHLIIATLHSNDNLGTIDRLMNLGVPLRSIAATLHVIISQRLIRKLCPHCRKKAELTPERKAFMERYGFPTENVCEPQGCPNCDGTGYRGRQALFEILVMEPGLRAVLEAPNASNTTIQEYVDNHQTTANIAGQALTLVSEGITSYEEFERVTLNL